MTPAEEELTRITTLFAANRLLQQFPISDFSYPKNCSRFFRFESTEPLELHWIKKTTNSP